MSDPTRCEVWAWDATALCPAGRSEPDCKTPKGCNPGRKNGSVMAQVDETFSGWAGGRQSGSTNRSSGNFGSRRHGWPRPLKKFLSATVWNRRKQVVVLNFCLINAVYNLDSVLVVNWLTWMSEISQGSTNSLCVGSAKSENNHAKREKRRLQQCVCLLNNCSLNLVLFII